MRGGWLVLLLLALIVTANYAQDDDPGPDAEPAPEPPKGPAGGGATAIKPPKEQGPDPNAPKPPGAPGTPPGASGTPPNTGPANPAGPGAVPRPPVPGSNPAPGAGPTATPAAGPTPPGTPPGASPGPGAAPANAATAPGSNPPGVKPPGVTPPGVTPPGVTPPGVTPPGVTPPGVTPPGVTPPGVTPPGVTPPGVTPPGVTPPGVTPPGVTPPGVPGASSSTVPPIPGVPPLPAVPGVPAVPGAVGATGVPGIPGVPGPSPVVAPPPGNETTNTSAPGDNSTAIQGIAPDDNSAKLVNALLGALGAKPSPPKERPNPIAEFEDKVGSDSSSSSSSSSSSNTKRTSSKSTRRRRQRKSSTRRSLPSASVAGLSFSDLRSSKRLTEGLLTASDGSSFCVAGRDMFVEPDSLSGSTKATFASADLQDPACDDDAVDKSKYCGKAAEERQQQLQPQRMSFMQAGAPFPPIVGSTTSMAPAGNASNLNCTQGFTKVGSAPRSIAVVLIKWARNYYKSKEACCQEQGSTAPDCDCKWNGYTYDNLPPPSAYSRMFTDECDGKPSINRAYYDLSGGMVTFHGRVRVPTPTTSEAEVNIRNGSVPDSSPAPLNTMSGYLTEKSYLDPDGVDVYGWAVLDSMRENGDGACKDWCGDAIKQLGVNATDYNHVMCMALYSQSTALCDPCDSSKQQCSGTCPAASGIATGCGCGTCAFAWGGQSSCNRPAAAGVRTGLQAPIPTYDDQEVPLLPGLPPRSFAKIARSNKVYMSHELGHNMGLTHAGSLKCTVTGTVINRQASGCTPDWYGDTTSFMGSGPDLQLPNAMKYKVRWLPRGTLKEHPSGTEQRYTLKATTSRRPSWQESNVLRWFDSATDTLAVRVPLKTPSPEIATVGGYKCPCPACPQCTAEACRAPGVTACCTDASCADKMLNYFYIELHMPYRNDNNPTQKGIAIRMMGDLSTCTSTRAVATHLDSDGKPKYLLDTVDPTGVAVGSRFVDDLRGVEVILEEWTRTQAVIRVKG